MNFQAQRETIALLADVLKSQGYVKQCAIIRQDGKGGLIFAKGEERAIIRNSKIEYGYNPSEERASAE